MFKKTLLMSLLALCFSVMALAQNGTTVLPLPYTEDFDTIQEFKLPQNWTAIGSEGYPRSSAIRGYNGSVQSLFLSMYYPAWAVLPEFNVASITDVTLSFYMYAQSAGVINVGVLSDPTDTTTFTLVQSVAANQMNWVNVTIPFSTYEGLGNRIAFTSTGSVYIDHISVTAPADTTGNDTTATVVIPKLPLITGFEDVVDNALWQITTTTTGPNLFYIGTAVNNGGEHALYISNDNGVSSAYTNNATTITFIHRPFQLENDNTVMISYDWACSGESGYDKGRVFIAPATADITALTSSEISNLLSNYTNNPAGWLNADGASNLSGVSNWTTKNIELTLTAGDYMVVIAWKNDNSSGNNPPIQIDNLSIREKVCYTQNVTTAAGAHDVTVNAETDCATSHVVIKLNAGGTVVKDTVGALPMTISGLSAQTQYIAAVNGFCASGDTTDTLTAMFWTLCDDIFVDAQNHLVDNFDSYSAGTSYNMGCWLRGNTEGGTTPYVTTSSYTGGNQSVAFSGTSTRYGYIATPNLTGTPINQLRVKFKASLLYTSYSMEVGVMDDPMDATTFTAVKRIFPEVGGWADYIVDLGSYTGTGHSIAFKTNGNNFNIDDVEILPTPSCLEPTFAASTSVATINVAITPAFATDNAWDVMVKTTANANDTVVPVYSQTVNDTNVVITNLDHLTTYYVFVRTHCSATEQSEWIRHSVATPCGLTTLPYSYDFSGTYPAACSNRYAGNLNNVMAGTASLSASSNGWYRTTDGKAIANDHAKVNLWSNSQYYWLVTPEMDIDADAELTFDLAQTNYNSTTSVTPGNAASHRFVVLVSTDGGSTWNSSNVLAEWNNSGSSLVLDNVSAMPQTVTFPLTNYVGGTVRIAFYAESNSGSADHDLHIGNIAVNYTAAPDSVTVDLTDQICQNYGYTNNGFDIPVQTIAGVFNFTRTSNDTIYNLALTVLPAAATAETVSVCASALPYVWNGQSLTAAGTYTFTTTAANGCDSVATLTLNVTDAIEEYDIQTVCENDLPYVWNGQSYTTPGTYTFTTVSAAGCDSTVTLYLMVAVSDTTYETATICQGQTYTWHGNSYTAAGVYDVVTGTSSYGCPIVAVLTLSVTPGYTANDTISVCDNELPYAWNGQDLTAAGQYVFNGTSATGCDSIVVLEFSVNATYAHTDSLSITDTELPYLWNGQEITAAGEYTFNGTTATGCDSVITLVLDVQVGLDYADDGMFAITPNPVEKGGRVRLDANVTETAVVELFTSNGKLISRAEYGAETIYVTMPQVAGLYMVRLTTASGRTLYGKVIVR